METIPIPPVDWSAITPILVVIGWATALLLIDVFAIPQDRKRVTGYLAIVGLIVAALAAIPLWGTSSVTFSDMLVLDNYSLTLNWIFLLVGVLSLAMALDYLPRQEIEQGEFYPLIMFAVGGMMLLAQGTDLIVLFLAVELLSITLYILAGFAYPRLASEEAAMKYLLLGAFSAGFFVYGIALIYGATGTANLFAIGEHLASPAAANGENTLLLVGAGMVLIAFGFKVALAPFHMWTPDVYEGAPTPVTAFMSVGVKGAAFAAMLRILALALPTLRPTWVVVLGGLAILTMLVGNIAAIAQTNVKRMLAYSSIGHAGYILLAIMAIDAERGVQGFLFYMLAYALTNLGAFGVVIALEQKDEAAWSLNDFTGLWGRQPELAIAMAIFMLSLAGVPPTAGFVGKFYVFTAAWESGLGWLVLVGVLTSAVAAFFYLRVIVRMFMQESTYVTEATAEARVVGISEAKDASPLLYRGLASGITVAAVGAILLGLIPTPVVVLVERSMLALAP